MSVELSNACYYTFSTISQTLAGAFGLLIAVVLYRLQGIGDWLDRERPRAIKGWDLDNRLGYKEAAQIDDFDAIADILRNAEFKEDYARNNRANLAVDTFFRDRFVRSVDNRRFIKRRLKRALLFTGSVTIASMGLLVATPLISAFWPVALVLMLADVGSAVYCFWVYYGLAVGVTE